MNRTTIIGNLVADPEKRMTTNGKSVAQFTVAVRKEYGEGAVYFRVSAWERLGDLCCQYLAKGKKVAVGGVISASAYQSRNGEIKANLDLNAKDIEFLSPKDKKEEADFGTMQDYNGNDLPWE